MEGLARRFLNEWHSKSKREARRAGSEMKHDASGGAGLILRGSVQLRAEVVHLNQAELHEGGEFDVEASADGGGEGRVGAETDEARALLKRWRKTVANCGSLALGFAGYAE